MKKQKNSRKESTLMPVKRFTVSAREKKIIEVNESGTYIIELLGEGAEAVIAGGIMIKGKDRVRIHTVQHHKSPHTKSDLLIKAVLRDSARLEYTGLIQIDKDAMNANAYQRQENLLLSKSAGVESKPELEIRANEVRCTHGATMAMIDEEQIFYLMSRGISRNIAENLITDGFLESARSRLIS